MAISALLYCCGALKVINTDWNMIQAAGQEVKEYTDRIKNEDIRQERNVPLVKRLNFVKQQEKPFTKNL